MVPHSKPDSQHSPLLHQRRGHRSPRLPVLSLHFTDFVVVQSPGLRSRNRSLGVAGLPSPCGFCGALVVRSTFHPSRCQPGGIATAEAIFEGKYVLTHC